MDTTNGNAESKIQYCVPITEGVRAKPNDTNQSRQFINTILIGLFGKFNLQNYHFNTTKMDQAQCPKTEISDTGDDNDRDIFKGNTNMKDKPDNNESKQVLENEIASKVTADKQSKFEKLIENLGLKNFFPNKINLMDVIIVSNPVKSLAQIDIPWIILKSLIMGNFNARDKMVHELLAKIEDTVPTEETEQTKHSADPILLEDHDDLLTSLVDEDKTCTRLNPMDLLVVLFNCSSPIFKQILAQKLFVCKLAVPISFPSLGSNEFLFSQWMLQTILIECKKGTTSTLQLDATNCPCHTVGFMRLGDISVSKSKLINDLLTDQYHDTFFNKDCPLGTSLRTISDGTIEGAWIIPSDNSDAYNDVVMVMNLRGDGLKNENQAEIITSVSSVVVVLIDVTFLQRQKTRNVLLNLHKSNKGVIIALDANLVDKNLLTEIYKDYITNMSDFKEKTEFCILSRKARATSFSDVKISICRSIKKLTTGMEPLTLSQRLKDEEDTRSKIEGKFRECKKKAEEILNHIPMSDSNIKDKTVELQGETWRTWTKYYKTLNQTSHYTSIKDADTTEQKMIEVRMKQLHMCQNLGPFMNSFIEMIVEYFDLEPQFTFIIWWLKLLMDERSRHIIPEYLKGYQKSWKALRSVRNKNQHDVFEKLKIQLNDKEYALAEASFGLEHLVREIGQMYEAMIECKFKTLSDLRLATQLAKVGAKMLLNGQPFEIMDGDVANVPLVWVKAVLTELKNLIGDKKLLALSILGVQSSGKSTLLNAMFGLQFAVSAGRCTRGVFVQLVKVKECTVPVDFIAVIDTEGLRAPELAHQKFSHDNELATFVIGLGDITIVNIKGENTAEVQDVLQIAVHAFLRLKLANSRINIKKSCIFIHQNVSSSDASNKTIEGRQKFLEKLDEMTQIAADQENIGNIHSFSQVIDFDCNSDVCYLSDLWNGDPPMAPLNPGYSKRVDQVRNNILHTLASERETYLTITETIAKIADLWKGIIKDDFIFSFRNSLEMKAYNSMERKYQELSWKLEQFVSKFVLSEAKSDLMLCSNEEDFANTIQKVFTLLLKKVSIQVNALNEELVNFIDSNSLKDIMIQWKQKKQIQLNNEAKEFISRSKSVILETKEEILVKKLRMNAQKDHEIEINRRAQQLAIEMRGEKPTEDILHTKFEQMWTTCMEKFNTGNSEINLSIKDCIESLFWGKFPTDAAFFECQTDLSESKTKLICIDEYKQIKDDIKMCLENKCGSDLAYDIVQMSDDEFKTFRSLFRLEGSIAIKAIDDSHITIDRKWIPAMFVTKEKRDTCKKYVFNYTQALLPPFDLFLSEIKRRKEKFHVKYVEEILQMIDNQIAIYKGHDFAITKDYVTMVTKHIMRYVSIWFTKQNVDLSQRHTSQYAKENDLAIQPSTVNLPSITYRNRNSNKPPAKLEGSIKNIDILENHISMINLFDEENWGTVSDIRNEAVVVTNNILKIIDTRLAEYNSQDVRFDLSFPTEIVFLISKEIAKHNDHLENSYRFNLLPPYRAMMFTHVKPFITDFFVRLNDKYNKKHSPKSQMKKYKGTVWTLFQNVVDRKTENVIAANLFRKVITKAVTDHVDDLFPILAKEHIMKSFAHEKYSLMKSIMIDLAEKEDFDKFSVFIYDPSEYTRIWMNQYIIDEMFDQGGEIGTIYARLAQSQIKTIMKQLSKCFSEASRICRNSEMNDISSWIQSFIQKSREFNTIPFSNEDFVHVQNRHVEDLENYTEIIMVDLEDIEKDISMSYQCTTQYSVQWKEHPISGIMEKLWGCTAKCMFCAEPCRHTGKNHIEEDIPHQCIQHRPQGIGGFHWEGTKHLVTEFCNFWVQTDQIYKWGKEQNKESRYYKEYKKHFPDWDIVPSHDTSKYWMWVMFKYQNELKDYYGLKEPNLPATWKLIKKEEAIKSLSFV